MTDEQTTERTERPRGPGDSASACWEVPPTCGPGAFRMKAMKDMMRGCPCATMMERHRGAVVATLAVIGLAFLVLQAGWILGVVAFFRTF